jgi:hypothetical protein
VVEIMEKEIKRMRVTLIRTPFSPIRINVNSHHRCRGKWKKNEWYDWYKKFEHTEKKIKEI